MTNSDKIIRFKKRPWPLTKALKFSALIGLIAFGIILSGSLSFNTNAESDGATIVGVARVVDGDTLEIKGKRIRIHGIDTPEGRQTCLRDNLTWLCGQEASALMRKLVENTEIKCESKDTDRYGRIVGKCFANEMDIGEEMVKSGMALAYRHYSTDYVSAEASAKVARRGLWSGEFVAPWDWRKGKRLSNPPANDNQTCQIKGNISSSGERIYHVPGGYYYGRTKIADSKGEKWFCSEEEARSAGWRRSNR